MIKIRKGLDLPIGGKPGPNVTEGAKISHVALIGADYPGLRPTMLVDVGDTVKKGQPIFENKKNPGVVYTAPAGGKIVEINRGEKRVFLSLVIEVDENAGSVAFEKHDASALSKLTREQAEKQLVASGLWTAFRTRPFVKTPAIGTSPKAIFVTAMDTNPLAADVQTIIESNKDAFLAGLDVLTCLTEGPVYVCKGEGSLPRSQQSQVQEKVFVGKHPAGLPGTHMHFLEGAAIDRVLWNIGYQDVIAIGNLFIKGELDTTRYVAIGGPGVLSPKTVRTVMGAKVSELVAGNLANGEQRVISGSVLYGRTAEGVHDYAGRFFNQVSVLPEGRDCEFLGWCMPGARKFSVSGTFLGPIVSKAKCVFNTAVNGGKRAIIPFASLDSVMPMDIIPSLLLRALAITDTDEAQALGCLELDEEDLALCTYVDPCKSDFGPWLRKCLDKIELEG